MLAFLRGVFITFVLLLIVDAIYLFAMKDKFNNLVRSIQFEHIDLKIYAAILCYLCIATVIQYFIILKKESVKTAGVLGMLIYGIFDFTNLAIFNKWTLIMSIMDITWGGMLFATVTIILRNFEF